MRNFGAQIYVNRRNRTVNVPQETGVLLFIARRNWEGESPDEP